MPNETILTAESEGALEEQEVLELPRTQIASLYRYQRKMNALREIDLENPDSLRQGLMQFVHHAGTLLGDTRREWELDERERDFYSDNEFEAINTVANMWTTLMTVYHVLENIQRSKMDPSDPDAEDPDYAAYFANGLDDHLEQVDEELAQFTKQINQSGTTGYAMKYPTAACVEALMATLFSGHQGNLDGTLMALIMTSNQLGMTEYALDPHLEYLVLASHYADLEEHLDIDEYDDDERGEALDLKDELRARIDMLIGVLDPSSDSSDSNDEEAEEEADDARY